MDIIIYILKEKVFKEKKKNTTYKLKFHSNLLQNFILMTPLVGKLNWINIKYPQIYNFRTL